MRKKYDFSKSRKIPRSSRPKRGTTSRFKAETIDHFKEFKDWKFLKPSKEDIRKINKKAKPYEQGKVKATRWKGSFDKTFREKA